MTTLSLLQHPRISTGTDDAGRAFIAYDMQGWGTDLIGTYWPEPRPADLPKGVSWDGWRYELPVIDGKGGRFSHVSEIGCKIMILKRLIEEGYFPPAPDNAHLDETDTWLCAAILSARETFTGRPRVGDFVALPDGRMKRCAHGWDDGMQLANGGSYSIGTSGRASMSGSLDPSELWEYLQPTDQTRPGQFWFFSHNIAGAGRGVTVLLPCRVYRLERFNMSEEQARAHPVATGAAEFWDEGHPDHLAAIKRLMTAADRT